jgi:hypothetical protein
MTTVRAKFKVTSKIPGYSNTTSVGLSAVYSSDPASENKAFTDATPSGQISIVIAPGKPALEAFEMGQEFYVDFTPA